MSLVIWATVAAAAVYWGLRLFVQPQAVPAQAVVASLAPPAGGDLTRLLGSPPVQPVAAAAEQPVDSRFRLLGVVAPRGGQGANGLALVSVDGKPAKAVTLGRELEPGLRLLSVSQREAGFGTSGAPATLKLTLPLLPEPARGRPGDAPPQAVGALPGQPMVQPQVPMQPLAVPGAGGRGGNLQAALQGQPPRQIPGATLPGLQAPPQQVQPMPEPVQAEPQQLDANGQPLR